MAKWSNNPMGEKTPEKQQKEMIMRDQLIKACRTCMQKVNWNDAKTNIMVYMNQSVGIGEHSDVVVEAIQEELDKMAAAEDRIEMLATLL